MKTKTTLLLVTLLLAIAAFGQAPNRACNLRSAAGAYGYSCSGFLRATLCRLRLRRQRRQGPVARETRLNGTILPWTHNTRPNDPATVNPDCTGSVTYEVTIAGQPAPDAHFEYVIVDDGREVKGFPVDAGYAVSCQLIREK